MIQLKDLCFRYRESAQPVLMDVNLEIPTGSFTGITGPAGSGKSTLTYILNGIVPYCYPGDFYGEALIDGHLHDQPDGYITVGGVSVSGHRLAIRGFHSGGRDALRHGELRSSP